MQFKILATTLLLALAAAHPSPTEDKGAAPASADSAKDTNGPGGAPDEMSTMAQKTWQARGGCLTQYKDAKVCLAQCKDEASGGKCRNWKSMTGVRTGGCCCGWYTCQCICEY